MGMIAKQTSLIVNNPRARGAQEGFVDFLENAGQPSIC